MKENMVSTYDTMKTTIKEVVGNGVAHLKAINDAIHKTKVKSLEEYQALSSEDKHHFEKLQFLQHVINDILHPSHKMSLKLFKEDKQLFQDLINRNKSARDLKILPPCFCSSCKLDNESIVEEKKLDGESQNAGKDIQ